MRESIKLHLLCLVFWVRSELQLFIYRELWHGFLSWVIFIWYNDVGDTKQSFESVILILKNIEVRLLGDKDIDLEFLGGKEKVDGICSVGC